MSTPADKVQHHGQHCTNCFFQNAACRVIALTHLRRVIPECITVVYSFTTKCMLGSSSCFVDILHETLTLDVKSAGKT